MPRDRGINKGNSCWALWPLTRGWCRGLGPKTLPDQLRWFSHLPKPPWHPTGAWSLSPTLLSSWRPHYPIEVYPDIAYQLRDLPRSAHGCACLWVGEIQQGLRRKESREFYFSLNYSCAYKAIVGNNCSMALNLVNKTPFEIPGWKMVKITVTLLFM